LPRGFYYYFTSQVELEERTHWHTQSYHSLHHYKHHHRLLKVISFLAGLRDHMEDSYTMIKDYKIGDNMDVPAVFVALFDGHSSHRGSELASQRLHEILAEQPELQHQEGRMRRPDPKAIESALKSAFEQADEEIIDQSKEKGKHFGTTAVCALLWGRELTVAHAGDSRAVLCRRNEAIRLTKDHKPASDPNERKRIENLGGRIAYESDRVISNPEASGNQSSLNMSRALGDYGHKHPRPLVSAEPTVIHLQLTPESEFVVLGTDGLFDVCSAGDVCSIVRHSLSISKQKGEVKGDSVAGEAARALVAEALQRGTADNVTAAVALLQWSQNQVQFKKVVEP
jgi:serine/threonine protein phosphatase PrpC